MNTYHSEILKEIKQRAGKRTKKDSEFFHRYMGTTKPEYALPSVAGRLIVKEWVKRHRDVTVPEFEKLISSLCAGKSHNENALAGRLLEYMPRLRKGINPRLLDQWLENAEGWGEVDSICQSSFSTEELLGQWPVWRSVLTKLSRSRNIHKRRAGLVLLAKSVRGSEDKRLADFAFTLVERLKHEKHILITKAISWLLREMTGYHPSLVQKYLDKNAESLPKIALRETRRKLLTGKKT